MQEAVDIRNELEAISDLPAIPLSIRTRDGQKVDTSSNPWRLLNSADGVGTVSIDWQLLEGEESAHVFTYRARYLIKLYLSDRLAMRNSGTVRDDYEVFLVFERWLRSQAPNLFSPTSRYFFDWSDYSEGIARGFLAHGVDSTAGKGKHFSKIRAFYRWGIARQYPDFAPKTHAILRSIRAPGNVTGHHVRFRDPQHGPFSPDELQLIVRATKLGKGRERDRAIVLLHLELGINQFAAARLKNKDLKRYEQEDSVYYQLDVPRVKKRTVQRETKRRPISSRLGTLLETLQKRESDAPLLYWLPKSDPSAIIRRAMQRFAKEANLISPQTNAQLLLHPRRFRYTLATHMAEEGASKLHIAEELDHTDTNHVDVYVKTVSSIADPVARATDGALLPLVRRFLGKIVDSERQAAFEDVLNQMIPGTIPHLTGAQLNVGGVGMCGRNVRKDGLCQLYPPLSCYLCPSFAALRTGPHEEMLNTLLTYLHQERETLDKRILMISSWQLGK